MSNCKVNKTCSILLPWEHLFVVWMLFCLLRPLSFLSELLSFLSELLLNLSHFLQLKFAREERLVLGAPHRHIWKTKWCLLFPEPIQARCLLLGWELFSFGQKHQRWYVRYLGWSFHSRGEGLRRKRKSNWIRVEASPILFIPDWFIRFRCFLSGCIPFQPPWCNW